MKNKAKYRVNSAWKKQLATTAVCLLLAPIALADGRLLGTPGVSMADGAGGGGIVPWAMISGYGTKEEYGGAAFATALNVDDFGLQVFGLAAGLKNRVEASYARQIFNVDASDLDIHQDVFGLKVRLANDLVYSRWPQLTLGVQHRRLRDSEVAFSVGAAKDTGTDFYLAAAKAWLDGPFHRTTLLNITARMTKANQVGILGFGSAQDNDYKLHWEASAGIFINRHWATGFDYKQKPDNLGLGEEDWAAVWLAWFISKQFSVTAAYADLGSVAGTPDQNGPYLSLQTSF